MKNWLKKTFGKQLPPEETGIELPTLNWFIHVLIENVGCVNWVRMTKEEQEKHDLERPYNAGYPYKVVTTPIPKGKDIVLKCSGTYTIKCDSEHTRNMIIEMARAYDALERNYRYVLGENASEKWHPVYDLKPIPSCSSFRGPRQFFVTSPELCYVNGGVCMGMEHEGKWYVFIDGKKIEHKPTHYRRLPPHPVFNLPEYEDVKTEVERLRKEAGRE